MRNGFLRLITLFLLLTSAAISLAQVRNLPLDGTLSGNLTGGKTDTFRIDAPVDGQIDLTLTISNGTYAWITLYDKDTTTVLRSENTNSSYTLSTDGLAAGTYFVRVYPYYGGQEPAYSIKFSMVQTPVANDAEPNDDRDNARTLAQNSTATGHVGYYYNKKRDMQDWYKITTSGNGNLQLKITSHNARHVWVYLFDNDGTTQLNAQYTDNNVVLNTDGLAAGTYYVRINMYYSDNFAPYTLTDSLFTPSQPQDTEPNDTKETALTLPQNSTTTGHVGYYYNKGRDLADWYKITTNADGMLQLKLSSHNARYVWVYLFDNDGTTQLNAQYTDKDLVLNTDGLAAGTYYVRVNMYYGDNFAPYTLTDSLFTPSQTNDNEPNDSRETASTLAQNSTTTGHVGYYFNKKRDAEDWYKITTTEDGMLQLKLTSHNARYVWVYLFDNNGSTQLNAQYTDNALVLNTDGLAAGTYYLRVNMYYGDNFAPYTLTDSLITYNPNDPEPNNYASTATLIPGNSSATGHTNFYYNGTRDTHDWWKINYTDTTGKLKIAFNLLRAKSDNNTRYVWFQVYKDTAAGPIYNNYTNETSSEINLTSLTQGFYYFKLFPYYGDNFSAYAITPFFGGAYITAGISILKATQGNGCNNNSLSYRLSGSVSPYTPYTVKLFKDNVPYDSIVINRDTVDFNFLPPGNYYATVLGFGAPPNMFTTSATSQFTPVIPTPVPSGIPAITKIGRTLYSTPHAPRETFQWFRNDVLIPGAADSFYYASESGSYKVRFANACGTGAFSNTISFANTFQAQTINFPVIPDTPYVPGGFIRLTATATSGLPVSFRVISGPATVLHDSLFMSGPGAVTVEATQAGNDDYGVAAPVQRSFNLLKAAQTITVTPVTPKIYGDAPFNIIAVSTSGLPVGFSVVSGPATLNGSMVTITGAGVIILKAQQAGNNVFNAAPDVLFSFCTGIRQTGIIKGDTIVCPTISKYYVENKLPGVIYEWTLSGGGILSTIGDTAVVQWQTAGTYTVSVKGYTSCDAVRSTASAVQVRVTGVIVPGPVSNMVPANGTGSLQLPLVLSWIPGPNTSSFDLFVWDVDSTQPSKPFASNLFSVSFTLPNIGFKYNHSYRWMVRSKNGCSQVNGPVQQFTLIAQPDLIVTSVQAPSIAFSGQSISVSWKVTNNGPGRTGVNESWTDAVFLSFDSIPNFNIPPNTNPAAWSALDFPIKPLLIAAVPNATALDSGQSYTNSINFKLPVNYSWPLYVYVITNFAPAPNAPKETNFSNDTAHAQLPVAVSVSPAPDLRVDNVVTPSSSFSGSTINIAYKVKNYGVTTPFNSGWFDKIYISKDPLFNLNNAILLTFPKPDGSYYFDAPEAFVYNAMQLQKDSSYTRSLQVVIPNFIYGSYFIYVVSDAHNDLYEGSLENNNINRSEMEVFLTPTPTLTIPSLTVPGVNASVTQSMDINWTIKNIGFNDNIHKSKGHYAGVLQHCSTCYQAPCPVVYCNGCVIICPPPQPGYKLRDSLGFGSSTWTDQVYLSSDGNNLDVAHSVLLGSLRHSGGPLLPDNSLPPNFQSSIPESLYPYRKGFEANTQTALNPGAEFNSTLNIVVPDNLEEGTYYLYVYANADKNVFEYPEQMQVRRSAFPIIISRPDLTIPNVKVPPAAGASQSVIIEYTLLNIGQGAVYNHNRKDLIYISSSPVFDATAQLIGSPVYTEPVPVNVPVIHQFNYKLPVNISGTRYFYVVTNPDSSFRETNMNNNRSAAAAINVSAAQAPNLLVSSIEMPVQVNAIFGFPFKYTIPNQGAGSTSEKWTDSIYISCSPVFNISTAYGVGARTQARVVAVGDSYSDSFSLELPYTFDINNCFSLPTTNAYFFVKANADNSLYEGPGGGNNNILGTPVKTVSNPLVDHTVTSVASDNQATVGRSYSATWTVKNIGQNPGVSNYKQWADGLYFSKDTVVSSDDLFAGQLDLNAPVNSGETYTSTFNNFIVPKMAEGNYYVYVTTNYNRNIHGEKQYANNSNFKRDASGNPLQVFVTAPLLPDLVDTILTVGPTIAKGQPASIKYMVTNKGAGVTYPGSWSDEFWLSSDYIPGNAGDIYLGSLNHTGALQPGNVYLDSIAPVIPLNVPAGNYILIATTNVKGVVFETDLSNNNTFRFVSIYTPAPVDLLISNISHADTVLLGYEATVSWLLSNNSSNALKGVETDGIYLSDKPVLDSTSVLIGTKPNTLNMLPLGTEVIEALPVFQGVTEGLYNLIVKADLLNNIVETNKDNNTTVASRPVYVRVKELMMEVAASDQMKSLPLYYKLVIPSSLSGATILLDLISKDSLAVINQVFVGHDYIPSAAHFAYQYNRPNAGNQQVLMPSVVPGVYYIMVRSIGSRQQDISLTAHNLPFAIIDVNSREGGNTGNVTIKLTGSLFNNNMKATLKNNAATVVASQVYFVNSISVFATFNLKGVPLGTYDVILSKGDTSFAVLAKGFSVVTANNGGLITGTGINKGQTGSGNEPGCDPGATSGLNAQLQTEIVIPPKVFAGWPFVIQINYTNPTNVDIPVQTRILYSKDGVPIALTKDGLSENKTTLYLEFANQEGPPGMIRAGGTGSISIFSKAPPNYPGHKIANYELK